MKKYLVFLLVAILMLSLVLVGCGSSDEIGKEGEGEGEEEVGEKDPPKTKQQITILTGSTGGTYFALGGAMANTWTDYLDNIQVTSQPSGASVENINRLNAGEVELGISMNNIADNAWNGVGAFDKKTQNFRTIGVVYPEVYQGVALKESGIVNLEDVKGKRVAVGPVGSGTVVLTEAVFAEAGLTFDDVKANSDGFGDAASKMQDGQLDAAFNVLSVPAAAIEEILTTREINIIEISDDLFAKLKAKHPFFSQYYIPAGTYGNTEDVKTINCQAALYCSPDLSEDMVYEITKVWAEHTAEVATAHNAAKWLADEIAGGNLQVILEGITTPLHKGAYKYYLEKGLDIPDEIKPID
ncbi:MAG TPA: TAXI family TRAP transporter solute-binding subunit [Eubacteriaceae bacterium]|jgi:TRAP transporter TAXI family solute receptor|nr:TAXI family TRAP transporter solute-binding subunit [Eubacteriaceae bacterium]